MTSIGGHPKSALAACPVCQFFAVRHGATLDDACEAVDAAIAAHVDRHHSATALDRKAKQ